MRYAVLRRLAGACAVAAVATVLPVASAAPAPVAALALAPLPALPAVRGDANGGLVAAALASSDRYFLGTWWAERMSWLEPWASSAQRIAATGTLDSEQVRRYSSVALAVAAPLATGGYDAGTTGVPAATATERVVALVRLMVRTHRANVGTDAGWGGSWQSALWASQAALAGWLTGDALADADRLLLARMLEYEADAVRARPMHYLRDRSGKVLTPGNSGGEELAWDALGELTAVELLPYHDRRAAWAEDAYRRFVASYARPADVRSTAVVNGRAFGAWLGGSNAEPNGFVVNHGRLNPDYTVSVSLHGAVVPALAGDGVPQALLVNQDVLYRALASTPFAAPPAKAPGGTVYVPGNPTLYYPSGPDWGSARHAVYATEDVEAAAFGLDRGLRVPAAAWARLRLGAVRAQQARFRTGQVYGPVSEDRYFAREEWAGVLLAYAHLTQRLHALGRLRVDRRPPADAKRPLAPQSPL
ncbi:MAG TPA: hypothetical protein VFQ85_05115 [Mycobacteriales bacterium]|jgi:hypothetical protein|nr:hypothetical protein [Mycobacteriales bacterium]